VQLFSERLVNMTRNSSSLPSIVYVNSKSEYAAILRPEGLQLVNIETREATPILGTNTSTAFVAEGGPLKPGIGIDNVDQFNGYARSVFILIEEFPVFFEKLQKAELSDAFYEKALDNRREHLEAMARFTEENIRDIYAAGIVPADAVEFFADAADVLRELTSAEAVRQFAEKVGTLSRDLGFMPPAPEEIAPEALERLAEVSAARAAAATN
jgi:hypothetical protein